MSLVIKSDRQYNMAKMGHIPTMMVHRFSVNMVVVVILIEPLMVRFPFAVFLRATSSQPAAHCAADLAWVPDLPP